MKRVMMFLLSFLLICSVPGFVAAEDSRPEKINYSMGYTLASDMQRAGQKVMIDSLLDGFFQASENLKPVYSQEELDKALADTGAKDEEALGKINYSRGFQAGMQLKKANIHFTAEKFLKGVMDSTEKEDPEVDPDEMGQLLKTVKKGES